MGRMTLQTASKVHNHEINANLRQCVAIVTDSPAWLCHSLREEFDAAGVTIKDESYETHRNWTQSPVMLTHVFGSHEWFMS
jgi:hypothetical protein